MSQTICRAHVQQFCYAWCLGERDGPLADLIDSYKFTNTIDAARMLGSLLAETIATLPEDTVIVPVPTIRPHVRQRGYDHAHLLARAIAKHHHRPVKALFRRRENTVQRGASKAQRLKQSQRAFSLVDPQTIRADTLYLIVDDVYTTGATVAALRDLLHTAGAHNVALAVATRQTLDE